MLRAFVLGALLVAGAAALWPAATPDSVVAEPAGMTPFAFTDCDFVEVWARVPAAAVAGLVPAPFVLFSTAGTATVFAGATACDAIVGDAAGPIAFWWTDVQVRPLHAALTSPGVNVYLWRLEHFTLDDAYGAASAASGAAATPADAITAAVGAAATSASVTVAGARHGVTVPLGEPVLPGGDRTVFREYGRGTNGFAFIEATLVDGALTGQDPAVWHTMPGSVAENVLGPVAVGSTHYGRGVGWLDGSLGSVAWP